MSKLQYTSGYHSVRSLLRNGKGRIQYIWMDRKRRDKRFQELRTLISKAGLQVDFVASDTLDNLLPDVNHQGIIIQVKGVVSKDERFLDDLLNGLDKAPFLLILDGVQDPHNLGAVLRTADAAGVDAVIAPKDRAVSLTETVLKVASGAADSVPYIQVTNLARTMRALQKEHNIWITGTSDKTDTSLYQADLKGPLALVMGAESEGMRRLTGETCDTVVSLPMAGEVSSLNVSVAAGVCLFEAVRQRSL